MFRDVHFQVLRSAFRFGPNGNVFSHSFTSLRVLFPFDDKLVFLVGNGAHVLETHFQPEAFGNEQPRQPIHLNAEVVEFPQVNIRTDRARLEAGEQMLSLCFKDYAIANGVRCGFFRCPPPAILGWTALGFDDGVENLLPCPSRDA